ncbi:MAG TPA: RNA-binding protein [Ignavibacteriaceae bacterium]|jgi:RNA recognition motif-containing protein|nr:MAG: RNA-binding protein [Ignavibacteriales bacterium UTCHB2]HQF42593.1 RNA-binding protein [Ignavibacteriaceae bacterium]HQI42100.1 RNA-binding protein [Ignavibacteriaceae bacterium]
MNIFVGNLTNDVTEEDLTNLFSEYGQVKEVKIIRDMFTQQTKGFGFVEMPGLAEAQKAIDGINTKEFKGKKLVVNEARPKSDSRKRFSSNRGGGRQGGGQGSKRRF